MRGSEFDEAGLLRVRVAGRFERVACGEDLGLGGGREEEGADAEVGRFGRREAGEGEGVAEVGEVVFV